MLLKTILPVLSLTSLALAAKPIPEAEYKAKLYTVCSTGPIYYTGFKSLFWSIETDLSKLLPVNTEDKYTIELINSPLNDEMHTGLMTTMIHGQVDDAKNLMELPYIQLNSTDLNGNNALHHGCSSTKNSTFVVKKFLEVTGDEDLLAGRSFDLEALNNEGQTAKQICEENNAINMTELAWPEAPKKEEENAEPKKEEEEKTAEPKKEEVDDDDSSASVASGSVIALISAFSFALLF